VIKKQTEQTSTLERPAKTYEHFHTWPYRSIHTTFGESGETQKG
jgi:hypothetical protein